LIGFTYQSLSLFFKGLLIREQLATAGKQGPFSGSEPPLASVKNIFPAGK
jgi:hypothetical protein